MELLSECLLLCEGEVVKMQNGQNKVLMNS